MHFIDALRVAATLMVYAAIIPPAAYALEFIVNLFRR